MSDDRRRREIEEEYRRYFPPVERPRVPLVQRVVGTVLFVVAALFAALIVIDICGGAMLRLLE